MNATSLQLAYTSDATVKAICDEMAGRERNQSETKLTRILARLRNSGADARKSEVIAAFRKLEESECGQYVEGRHGWPSRFVWAVGSMSACQIAQGTEADVESLPESDEEEEIEAEIDTVTHLFRLREDFSFEIQLPSDLTQRESQRIASFVASLPMEE